MQINFWAYQENYVTDEHFLKKFNSCQLQGNFTWIKRRIGYKFL